MVEQFAQELRQEAKLPSEQAEEREAHSSDELEVTQRAFMTQDTSTSEEATTPTRAQKISETVNCD